MTPLEQEMLAALKAAETDTNWCAIGHSAMYAVRAAIAKAEPKPHVWYSDQKYPDSTGCYYCPVDKSDPIHIQPKPRSWVVEFKNCNQISPGQITCREAKVIREVKPITREQIQSALRKRDEKMFVHESRLALLLRELGIDVED